MEEIWKDIVGYEGLYRVSNLGRVKSLYNYHKTSERLLKQNISSRGYYIVSLVKNHHKKQHRVHQLVATAYLINYNNYPMINHKDGNKLNNCVDNLEYCTAQHNVKESFRLGLSKPHKTMLGKTSNLCPNSIPVNQYDLNGNFIKTWKCGYDAIRELDLHSNHITDCCKGKRNHFAGYKWRYADEV